MKYLVTGKEMKLLDQNTSGHFKVPELVLMEQAAMQFVWRLCDILDEKAVKEKRKGIVFCGLGNNGADENCGSKTGRDLLCRMSTLNRIVRTNVCYLENVIKINGQKTGKRKKINYP